LEERRREAISRLKALRAGGESLTYDQFDMLTITPARPTTLTTGKQTHYFNGQYILHVVSSVCHLARLYVMSSLNAVRDTPQQMADNVQHCCSVAST